tara:strand:+ start:587 stop:844 length:258 start_codon:yes stop_codon:yes gene_type:complete
LHGVSTPHAPYNLFSLEIKKMKNPFITIQTCDEIPSDINITYIVTYLKISKDETRIYFMNGNRGDYLIAYKSLKKLIKNYYKQQK